MKDLRETRVTGADSKWLPSSILERNKGEPIAASETSLYQLVLPRLVTLIDLSELVDLGIADKVGRLLAELHETQHELPAALFFMSADFSIFPETESLFRK